MTSSETPHPDTPAGPEVASVVERIGEHERALDELSQRPLAQHADLYGQVHTDLQAALAAIDSA